MTKDRTLLRHCFGIELRRLREQRHLSQEKMASHCNLDRTYISLMERGIRTPSLFTVFEIAHALEMSPSDIIKVVESRLENTPNNSL